MSESNESQMREDVSDVAAENAVAYWRANVGLIWLVLGIWAFVGLGMSVLFMPYLQDVFLPGFKVNISFWFAHQGAIYVFVILIFAYAWRMDAIDSQYKMTDE